MNEPRWGRGTFLARLAPAVRAALLALGTARELDAGRVLLREADPDDGQVELLLRGFVKVTIEVEGVTALMSIRVPGDLLGESALRGRPRTATVMTCGRVQAFAVGPAPFRRFLAEYPDAALAMAAAMSERLLWSNQRRGDYAAYPPEVRLARVLSDLGERCGVPTAQGLELGVTLSQSELATMVGVGEATIHNALTELRRRGLVRTGYRKVVIVDGAALRKEGR